MDNSNTPPPSSRLFIGIKISASEQILTVFEELKQTFKSSRIKWTIPENLHITLRFLGGTPDYYQNALNKVIEDSCNNINPFTININSVGFFGESKPKIIWLGIKSNPNLIKLFSRINSNLEALGLNDPTLNLNPHITLGRIKQVDLGLLKDVVQKFEEKEIMRSTVTDVHLYESVTKPSGARYYILNSHALG